MDENKRKSAPDDALNRLQVHERRLQNLNNQIAKFEQETGSKGAQRRFAKLVGINENLLSQIRNKDRGLGPELARKIEDKLHLGRGWLDDEHADWTAETPEEREHLAQFRAFLRRLDTEADRRRAIRQFAATVRMLEKSTAPKKKPRS